MKTMKENRQNGIAHKAGALTRGLLIGATLSFGAMAPAHTALAQGGGGMFAPVLNINGMVITQYELDQRMLFLTLLRFPGDIEQEALRGLTQDRLAQWEARRVGLKMTGDAIRAGMDEFAARANLTGEQFLEAIGQGGVSAETFRDFVASGLMWRDLVRAKFGEGVSISEVEIDRAIARGVGAPAAQLLLSEITLRIEGDSTDERALAAKLRGEIRSEEDFAKAAQQYSDSPTAARGGRLDWTPASRIPPDVVAAVIGLQPGKLSAPIATPEAIVLFQLRGIQDDPTAPPPDLEVEYAEYLFPNTPNALAEAEAIHNRVDFCTDLYAENKGTTASRVTLTKVPVAQVPADIATRLSQMDPGEYSADRVRGDMRVFLMLCGRSPANSGPVDRKGIADQLVSAELGQRAELWLEELRSEAIIVTQ